MSWTDKIAIQNILKLRDRFNIGLFVETGTSEGTGTRYFAHYFPEVYSCEVKRNLYNRAKQRTAHLNNVHLHCGSSPVFLAIVARILKKGHDNSTTLFFLDAHTPGDWPILDELRALRGLTDCCIVIHDFKIADLGHICYEGQALDFDYVRTDLMKVNPNFHLYHNTRELSDVWTIEETETADIPGLPLDDELRQQMQYVWLNETKTYRGILYAVPQPLDDTFQLKALIESTTP